MTREHLIHPFEEAGLGQAPFRCTGMTQRRNPDSGQPTGTCGFCGEGILYCFHIKSADDKAFIVGSDCVRRTHETVDDKGLSIEVRRFMNEAKREKREATRQKNWERCKSARELLSRHPAVFAYQPHPHEFFAKQGLTYHDYMDYCLRSSTTIATKIARTNYRTPPMAEREDDLDALYEDESWDEDRCFWCGGEGYTECPDPLECTSYHIGNRYGANEEVHRCSSCGGSGLAKDMTLW